MKSGGCGWGWCDWVLINVLMMSTREEAQEGRVHPSCAASKGANPATMKRFGLFGRISWKILSKSMTLEGVVRVVYW